MSILEISGISYFSILRRTRHSKKILKTILKTYTQNEKDNLCFGLWEIDCGAYINTLGKLNENYLRNLKCWRKTKNSFDNSE
jgi:hypothetical protein